MIQYFQPNAQESVRLRYAIYWPKRHDSLTPVDQVIIIPGRTTFIEQYQEVIDQLLSEGRAVWIVDLRGQGGSDRVGPNSKSSWIPDFEQYVDDLIAWIEKIILPTVPKTLSIMGISLGSLCTLLLAIRAHRLLSEPNPPEWAESISKLLLITPLVKVQNPLPEWFLKPSLYFLNQIPKLRNRCVWGYQPMDPKSEKFLRAYQGTDLVRFQRYYDCIFRIPHYFVSGLSITWAAALVRALDTVQDFQKTGEQLIWPTFVVEAGQDKTVDNQAMREYLLPMLKQSELVRLESASHNVFLEVDPVWDELWEKMNKFL